MIYPATYQNNNSAEEKVYNALAKLPDEDFTIFYNQQFTSIHPAEKNEYELDFIIADHRNGKLNAIIVVEVKGGNMAYDGVNKVWTQNARPMTKAPNDQASSSMNSLVKRFKFLSQNVTFHWVLWFPDVTIRENEWLPTNVSKDRLLDAHSLSYVDKAIPHLCNELLQKSTRAGAPMADFLKFQTNLLRSVGFFKPLHKEFEENELTFKKLTNAQAKIFKYIDKNQNICVQGPAGSGKTFIAYNKALEYAEQGLKVMYVCFNKALATELRHRSRNQNIPQDYKVEFTNFHYWAKRIAETNPSFNNTKESDDFFITYIPNKAKEMIVEPMYDVLIIDEGQDFRENWLELLNKVLKKEGRFLFLMDENQNIFETFKGVPHHRDITKCHLEENCRNTKLIIDKLKEALPEATMIPMEGSPDGQPVKYIQFEDNEGQIAELDNQIHKLLNKGIRPNQIMVLTNNGENGSSLKGVKTLGDKRLITTFDREYGKDENCVAQTTINVFKGLEADVVFILDAQNIPSKKNLYTQASRAKQLLYVFNENLLN
ncbi:UvrD-helicase domain-containing protein [Flavobacterium chuncheonense]|uniref:DNA 3'-5' helicase II n=1 Tax=Flavobacterium chuncheonense TaxID=2026653 RepID=A0ABW5YJD3_9FLAO